MTTPSPREALNEIFRITVGDTPPLMSAEKWDDAVALMAHFMGYTTEPYGVEVAVVAQAKLRAHATGDLIEGDDPLVVDRSTSDAIGVRKEAITEGGQ